MSIIKTEEKHLQTESESDNTILYHVFPDMHRHFTKDQTIEFEVSLPGVAKENIKLKALNGWFNLSATRGQMDYAANQNWGKDILPEQTTAKYENGLLSITAHIRNPLDDAKVIAL
ncbi:MAG: Hsp20/alpha crystallin family protein [Promethearchaeota archaeon]